MSNERRDFVDTAKIHLKAGNGGNGAVAFRREKYVPAGGPDGGDGGRGGDIIFEVDEGLRTLLHLRYHHRFKAENGENGSNKQRYGRDGADLILRVPPGTLVRDAQSGQLIADLVTPGTRRVIARGGRGGRGNMHFATSQNRAPEIAENGEPGEERIVVLELRLLADVGLVGLPNAGKSTLLSVLSNAHPRIGDYPFTTLTPQLGMVQLDAERSFVLADLPGLIAGAHEGAGLGLDFLRHIARTRVLLFVLDMVAALGEGPDPIEAYRILDRELSLYDPALQDRPRVVAANKMDLPGAEAQLHAFLTAYPDLTVCALSAVTHQCVDELRETLFRVLQQAPPIRDERETEVWTPSLEEDVLQIERQPDGWVVRGRAVERLVAMTNFDHEQSIERFQHILERMGVEDALRRAGVQEGDEVRIGRLAFEYVQSQPDREPSV
ncbi:MAG: GTPase ObgE [Firmicutes bacterium]|nr:GTPase ObgE [Bacillota bacterium]